MLGARAVSVRHSCPRSDPRHFTSAPCCAIPRAAPVPAPSRSLHLVPHCKTAGPVTTPTLLCAPTLRALRVSPLGLRPRLKRSFATDAAPAPESKPAAAEKKETTPPVDATTPPLSAEKPVDSTDKPVGSSASEEKGKSQDKASGEQPVVEKTLFSKFLDLIRDNKGVIWMVLLINFIIWLNSFMLDTSEAKIAESLDFDLTDDERMFAWSSLKMLSQFQPPHADKRYLKNVRQVIFEGIADEEPIIKEAALAVLTGVSQSNEKVQRQVMKDLEQIGFENLWERMEILMQRTPSTPAGQTTKLGASAQDPLPARIRYRFTTLFAYLASNQENHETLVKADYTSAMRQMLEATAGSGHVLDRLARQDIAGTFFSLSATGTKDKLLQEDIVAALVKLKEEGPDNADGTRSLAAKALVNLSTLPASKTLASFPRLTPRDYELAKQEVESEAEPERQSFWQWWRPNEHESTTNKVLNFGKPIAFVASVAWIYGALRTANYKQAQWRNKANWKHAFTSGGAKATAGAMALMGLSMGFDMLISTPLEKKLHINPAHAELTFFVLALPTLTRRLPYCLAPVMGSAVYEIYQNYTEDFVPEQMETANDLMDTTVLTMQLKDRIEKNRIEEAKLRAATAARARAETLAAAKKDT